MLEGKMFLPLTGIPILKRARRRTVLAVWLPEPLTVAATSVKLLTPAGLSSISEAGRPRGSVGVLIGECGLSTSAARGRSRSRGEVMAGRSRSFAVEVGIFYYSAPHEVRM